MSDSRSKGAAAGQPAESLISSSWRAGGLASLGETASTMKTDLVVDEIVVRAGPANFQRRSETVGGRLYLTNRRLIFESHAFNAQTGTTIIARTAITSVRKCWTKLLDLIPLLPNSIAVRSNDGMEYRFVVFGRQGWIDAIIGQQT